MGDRYQCLQGGDGLIAEVKERLDIKLFEITKRNRDFLFSEILKEVEMGSGWKDLKRESR
jgi:hypothetical protein